VRCAAAAARALATIGLLCVSLIVSPASAAAAGPQANLPDVEDEVMCTICGTLLAESESPQADRERALIRKLITKGDSKDQIKDALVAQYGPRVLATPSGHGFDLLAWIVPGFVLGLAVLAIGLTLRRGRGGRGGPATEPPALSPEDQRRVEADLADFDT
jgi:cytochrome c-type biogenesis protein CcmH